ncbi:MAG: glutaminyl-peptide cyclotransferase [bacterium]|nr:glutaminyl-peptide cyclotransferase [bacterium]
MKSMLIKQLAEYGTGGVFVLLCFFLLSGQPPEASSVKQYRVKILNTLPHSTESFTQGLLYYDGALYESTGLRGRSSLQKLDAENGEVLTYLKIPGLFAEGLARWEDRLIQLTWKSQIALVYALSDFVPQEPFRYATEGWGLTADAHSLIMSDGSDLLYFHNPQNFAIERRLQVTLSGKPLTKLNELEYIDGLIYANVWYQKHIVQIDPASGEVVGLVDAGPLFEQLPFLQRDDVLNGIAYKPESKTVFLTGKNWPRIFEVTLEE